MLLAGAIFVLTLVLVIWQPRGLRSGWSAGCGPRRWAPVSCRPSSLRS
ncbi:hypothetical protein AM387_18385 [Klebsiella pneumoniae]|nr:hypothetical protein AM389_24695 [Klebsiella pneumoniae]EIV2090049.1 hypothetical protein [Klebsiella pneumoniae subsp. ozaenae]HBR1512921.1 hypothetical protein [Klebsiella quasipneumoniae subsp. quasipneumoniae]AWS85414.1 hypothetical protein AM387_18385 [Klebsiella pneumoniae]EIW9080727.1 hypothetical protein [Klebsiella pneumoniae]